MTSAMPKENAEGHLVWNPSVGLYHKPAEKLGESYGGIIGALQDQITQQNVPVKAYPHNFAGIIAAIQDLQVATTEPPVTPDDKPPNGNIIIDINGNPIWDEITKPEDGMLWFDTRQGRLFVAVDGEFWQTNGADGLAAVTSDGTTPDADPVIGQFWWSGQDDQLYVFDGHWKDTSGNIFPENGAGRTPVWVLVSDVSENSIQTTATVPLAAVGPKVRSLPSPEYLPELDPTTGIMNTQKDYNEWIYAALLSLDVGLSVNSPTHIGEAPPLEPKVGDLWYDSTTLDMSVWYVDDDAGQWAPIASPFNYDADLETVRFAIAEETRKRELAIDYMRQQIADFDAADNSELYDLKVQLETVAAAIRREIPKTSHLATTATVNALEIELKEAIANHTSPVEVDLSHLATKQALSDVEASIANSTVMLASKAQLDAMELKIPNITGLATRDFVRETFDNITTTFLPRGGGELTGSFTMVKEDYSAPVFDFSTAPHYGKDALKFQTALNTTTTFGTTESPYELGWQFGSEEDYCWLYNDSKVFSISKEGPACSTLILGDFSPNNSNGRVIRNKIDLKQRLTDYQFAFETMRQGVATATDFDSLKANILSALANV